MLEHKIFNYSINIFARNEKAAPERYQVDFDCEISKCGCEEFLWAGREC